MTDRGRLSNQIREWGGLAVLVGGLALLVGGLGLVAAVVIGWLRRGGAEVLAPVIVVVVVLVALLILSQRPRR